MAVCSSFSCIAFSEARADWASACFSADVGSAKASEGIMRDAASDAATNPVSAPLARAFVALCCMWGLHLLR